MLPIRAAHQPFVNVSAVSACEDGRLSAGCTFSTETARRLKGTIEREQYGGVEDLFSDFFRSIFGGFRAAGPQASVTLTLQEAYQGVTREIPVGARRIEVRIPPGVRDGSWVHVPAAVLAGTLLTTNWIDPPEHV